MHQRILKQSRKFLPLSFDLTTQIGRESDHALLRQRALNQRVDVPPPIPQLSDAARLVAEVVQEAHDRGGQDVAGGVWVGLCHSVERKPTRFRSETLPRFRFGHNLDTWLTEMDHIVRLWGEQVVCPHILSNCFSESDVVRI